MSSDLVTEAFEATPSSAWRTWLWVFLATLLTLFPAVYIAVLVIDPFSTGRFALTQGIDFTTRNVRLGRAGLVRDPQFNGVIVGSSSAFPLDPARAAAGTGWRIAQLGIPAALPPDQLVVARAFDRHHRGKPTLTVFVLDSLWCRPGRPDAEPFGPFPAWVYESSDTEYLLNILSTAAVEAAAKRVAIWWKLRGQDARFDGYAPVFPRVDRAAVPAQLQKPRTSAGGSGPEEPYPALDLMSSHLAAMPANAAAFFVFAPVYVNSLPPPGSRAAARLQTCKDRVRQLSAQRPGSGYLDLRTDNAMARNLDDYTSEIHYGPQTSRMIEDSVARALQALGGGTR